MIKLIVSDLDGTLLSSSKGVSKETLRVIQEAKAAGIEFMMATGREYKSVKTIQQNHDLACDMVLMNGAQYRLHDGSIQEFISLNADQMSKIIHTLWEEQPGLLCHSNLHSYAVDKAFRERWIHHIGSALKLDESALQELSKEEFLTSIIVMEEISQLSENQDLYCKIEAFDFADGVFGAVEEKLKAIAEVEVIAYGQRSMEITHHQAQKGMMLERVIQQKGYRKDEVMVLGDGWNDVSMFQRFPVSVAMGNALPQIQAYAAHVTKHHDEDGVAHAIRQYAL